MQPDELTLKDRDTASIIRDKERIEELEAALKEIIKREDKAWKPTRLFRSEHQVELDEAKHEAWTDAADIARKALNI